MNNKKYAYGFMVLALLGTLAMTSPAFAEDTTTSTTIGSGNTNGYGGGVMNRGNRPMMKLAVFGTVSAISGNTITVTSKQSFATNATSTTFTVDATNAKIMKNSVVGTVASIVVGDIIMVQGTVNGTSVIATNIRDGQIGKGMMRGGLNNGELKTPQASPITGNGQPIVAGNVSVVNGSTLTITNKSNVTYTVDATNAKIVQGQNSILISNIAVGDMVVVQGTVNGNSIVATSVIDQPKQINPTTNTPSASGQVHRGFFGSIGHFFSSMFGF